MTATGITGWWPLIQVLVNLPVLTPVLGMSAVDATNGAFQLDATPALTMGEAARDVAAFQLAPSAVLAPTGADVQPAISQLATPSVSLPMLGVDVQPAAFSLNTSVALAMAASPTPLFDHAAISARQIALASGTPFTWLSGGGTAGAYGIVFIPGLSTVMTLAATAVVTWGGVPMTSLGSAYNDNNSGDGWGWVFVLPSVAAGGAGIPGGSQTISVTLTQSGKTFYGYGSSYSYLNVTSAGALQTAYGVTTNPTLTVPAANPTDIVWGALTPNNSGLPSAFTLTTREGTAAVNPYFLAGDAIAGGASVNVGATISGAYWSAFGLDLQ